MLKLLLLAAAFTGPGSSGGNPTVNIASPARGYIFAAPSPTGQKFTPDAEHYDFSLAGFMLDIRRRAYDPALCAATNPVKTVCDRVVVVGRDRQTFELVFTDTGAGAVRMQQLSEQIIQSFTKEFRP
jgi:hypothetical protein